jgi:hypothetical protein
MAFSLRKLPVFHMKTGKLAGFTFLIAAYERDGVLSLNNGEVVWYWAKNGGRA